MADLLDFGAQPLLSFLPAPLAARLTEAASLVAYKDGETIHSRGEVKPGLSLVRKGAVRFANPGADGSQVTTSVLGPGHCFGEATLFAGLPRAYDAIAVGDTLIDQITKPHFDRIFDEEPVLARKLLEAMTQRLYSVLGFMDDMRMLPLRLRTAKLILGMTVQAKRTGEVECNQSDLAFTLGVSRVSIGKALAELQSEGLISLGYGRIGVIDPEQLSAWIAARSPIAPLMRMPAT